MCDYVEPTAVPLPKDNWTATASSYTTDLPDGNGLPQCLIDGRSDTYWMTNYNKNGVGN